MPKFKVRLVAQVTVAVATDVVIEAPNEDEALDNAIEQTKAQEDDFRKRLAAYHRNIRVGYPERPFSWDVDSADVEDAIDWDDVETDAIEPVKERCACLDVSALRNDGTCPVCGLAVQP